MLLKVLSCRPLTLLYIQNSLNSDEPTRLTGISVFTLRMIRFRLKLQETYPEFAIYIFHVGLQSTLETPLYIFNSLARGTMNTAPTVTADPLNQRVFQSTTDYYQFKDIFCVG